MTDTYKDTRCPKYTGQETANWEMLPVPNQLALHAVVGEIVQISIVASL